MSVKLLHFTVFSHIRILWILTKASYQISKAKIMPLFFFFLSNLISQKTVVSLEATWSASRRAEQPGMLSQVSSAFTNPAELWEQPQVVETTLQTSQSMSDKVRTNHLHSLDRSFFLYKVRSLNVTSPTVCVSYTRGSLLMLRDPWPDKFRSSASTSVSWKFSVHSDLLKVLRSLAPK